MKQFGEEWHFGILISYSLEADGGDNSRAKLTSSQDKLNDGVEERVD